ncbi:MAG: hypothetical protein Q9162_007052 [Coniocarpon cinnabarinum]
MENDQSAQISFSKSSPNADSTRKSDATSSGLVEYARAIHRDAFSDGHQPQQNLQKFLRCSRAGNTNADSSDLAAESQDIDAVLAFLSSTTSDIIVPAMEDDLSHPMSHYFISSSHNTYLTGNQLYSDASVDGYMKIDVWDGKLSLERDLEQEANHIEDQLRQINDDHEPPTSGTKSSDSRFHLREKLGFPRKFQTKSDVLFAAKDKAKGKTKQKLDNSQMMPKPWKASSEPELEPRVLHGHTLTKEVPFRWVCKAIAATAFVTSDLPLIVSLEVHCGLEQQAKMVEIMQDVWSDYLLDVSRYATGNEQEYTASLPSPGSLRNKILIKVKYTPPEKAKSSKTRKADKNESDSSDNEEEQDAGDQLQQPNAQPKKKILDELSLLGVYTRSFHFKSFQQKEAEITTHVFALSESKVKWAIEEHSLELAQHNKKFFMRAYPKGARLSSSNLNPIRMWRHGVQMVALNWQSCDKSMMLNEGMFGGTTGWVLKPRSYWDPGLIAPADASTMDATSSSADYVRADALSTDHKTSRASGGAPETDSFMEESPRTTDPDTAHKSEPDTKAPANKKSQARSAAASITEDWAAAKSGDVLTTTPKVDSIPCEETSTTIERPSRLVPQMHSIDRGDYMLQIPRNLNLSISFCAGQDLPLPNSVKDKHFRPYIKCILHTEAVPSEHRSRSASRSTSPHPQSGRHIGHAKETVQAARTRASSLLKDSSPQRSNSSTKRKAKAATEDQPASTRARPRHKIRTATQTGSSPDFKGETVRFQNIAVDTEAEYMTFVRIKVMHDVSLQKDELTAWGCARLGRLRDGWGWWHLKDRMGEESQGKVLVKVRWELDDRSSVLS